LRPTTKLTGGNGGSEIAVRCSAWLAGIVAHEVLGIDVVRNWNTVRIGVYAAPFGTGVLKKGPREEEGVDHDTSFDCQNAQVEQAVVIRVALCEINADRGGIDVPGIRVRRENSHCRVERLPLTERRKTVEAC
jgi:hypothetical protein